MAALFWVQRRHKSAHAPKKGRTAYVLFMMDYRAALKANLEKVDFQKDVRANVTQPAEADFAAVSKQVSEAWKNMDAQAREPYIKRQQEEMRECVPCPLLECPPPLTSHTSIRTLWLFSRSWGTRAPHAAVVSIGR